MAEQDLAFETMAQEAPQAPPKRKPLALPFVLLAVALTTPCFLHPPLSYGDGFEQAIQQAKLQQAKYGRRQAFIARCMVGAASWVLLDRSWVGLS
eukprot:s4170_g3.t3